eukprot:CAMPEP_0177672564 /NCGR_PEP_ID=MMETSP0447-20121125/25416_1 /TAXON_ID=0 /ORGANISM="Stygamoeba regulata, Strain BSH-02190019" /LENGTH=50 /DNA_ID=CAMNT_0019180255 /DNA_START=15 /DNA_END=164 /DNA_ORIENTATION=-
MTEYWVSSAKHYCKVCNVWMTDNKETIRRHEAAKKHKLALDLYFKEQGRE